MSNPNERSFPKITQSGLDELRERIGLKITNTDGHIASSPIVVRWRCCVRRAAYAPPPRQVAITTLRTTSR